MKDIIKKTFAALRAGGVTPKVLVILLVVVLGVGYWLGQSRRQETEAVKAEAVKKIWTCSMHPQIQLPKPGLCPICNMQLIELEMYQSQGDGATQLTVSESASKLMDVEVVPVERRFVEASVRMSGKVDYDETNLAYITSWIPGRLDRLYVDYTGVPVSKGDHMVYLYSPELISAQEELLQAIESVKDTGKSELGIMRDMSESTLKAVREKLGLWGVTQEQISEVERTGKVSDHMTIYSPTSGIVIHKNAVEGMYVETGTKIYTIADLTKVWVKLDAYESDLKWVRYGQVAEFETVSYPGEIFAGTVSFIDPVVDGKTRTIKVRVNVANADGKLKPGMFVKAVVRSKVAEGGRVMNADFFGKWICPMHPEIVKSDRGQCDICQMPLVQTQDLGYVSDDPNEVEMPLVVPVSAVMVTGTRGVVYVKVADSEKPTFEGREIVVGSRAGDYYIVQSGLEEGELVVVKGNFKIDSSLQIMAKPSMMSPSGSAPPAHDHGHGQGDGKYEDISEEFRGQLGKVFDGYFAMQMSLAGDDFGGALNAVKAMRESLKGVDEKLLSGAQLGAILREVEGNKEIESLRKNFGLLNQEFTEIAKRYGATGEESFYILHCPMAFDNAGADWLQNNDQTSNPYFGQMMLRCGDVKGVIGAKEIRDGK